MQRAIIFQSRHLLLLISTLALFACGGSGGGGAAVQNPPQPTPAPTPEPAPEPIVLSSSEATRFLSQATFGPSADAVDQLIESGAERWLLDELEKPASLHLEKVLSKFPEDGQFLDEVGMPLPGVIFLTSDSFWQTAIEGSDQLRQRMAFALSQILVISADSDLALLPQTVAYYADLLTTGAFGNYRDLLQDITYSPAMAIYLTYLRNEKADPLTGRVPDENYARELLQLFTLGLVELNPDGTPVLDAEGKQIELFDNSDITEFAKVFTGLSASGTSFRSPLQLIPLTAYYSPLTMFDDFHSMESKTFLGTTIPAGTTGDETINLALDAVFAHPNVGPFLGRQLIQRFVTSAPSPAYVSRVTEAFDMGAYTLPSGVSVGSGERGDMKAVIAAVLFDSEARDDDMVTDPTFGKLREPVLRFTHWARAFKVNSADATNELILKDTGRSDLLGQHPYRSPSVFNFYRPGYIAPGTETGDAELTAPELQITNASTLVGYPNFMTAFALGVTPQLNGQPAAAFRADYSTQVALAADTEALLTNLDELLTHGSLQNDTRTRITQLLSELGSETEDELLLRSQIASVLVMTSPEYIVLR
ncbi:MAG: DUF1800 family protein [Halioglobus sp.]